MSDERTPPGMQTEQVPVESPPTMSAMSAPPPPAPAPAPGRKLPVSMVNAARGLKLVALLLFLLPWVTVSCADQTLVSMSGLDIATGTVTAHNPMTGEAARPPESGEMDLPVLIAALLIAAALVVSFVLKRAQAALASMAALAVAAVLIVYTVLVRLPAKAREGVTEGAQGAQGIDQAQIAQMIRVETQIGFWLTLAAIVAAIVVTWMARREAPPG